MKQRIRQTERWTRGLDAGVDEGANQLPVEPPPPPPPPPSSVTPLWRTRYDTVANGSSTYVDWDEATKDPSRIMYVYDPLGQRGIVQRVELYPGDNNVLGSGEGERAQVLPRSGASGYLTGFRDGDQVIMSWSIMLPTDFASPDGGFNNDKSTHASGGGNQSPFQSNIMTDAANWAVRIYGGGTWLSWGQPAGSVGEWFQLGTLSKNQWHDIVLEMRYGSTGSGYIRVWRNNVKVLDATNRKIGYTGDPGMYYKQGFYRAPYTKITRYWNDDTFRWASVTDAFSYYGWS